MSSIIRWAMVPALLAGCLINTGAVFASAPQVKDDGKFFKADAIQKANDIIKEIERGHQKDLIIETMEKGPAGSEAKPKGSERDQLFNEWARKRAKELGVKGIYIAISRTPSHIQIEVGQETLKRAFTARDRTSLRELLIGKFREKQFDAGLVEAAEFVRDTMDSNLGRARTKAAQQQAPAGGFGSSLAGLICFGLVAVVVIWLVMGLIRAFTGSRGGGGGYRGGPGGGSGPGYGGGGGGGGGGFMSGLMGGLFGGAAGSFLYDRFFRGDSGHSSWGSQAFGGESGTAGGMERQDQDYSGTGGDFGDDAGSSGGEAGGGDFGGGDFGGGDFGGGDFGGDSGGGGGDF
jgi:uncharacterized protein